MGVHLVLHLHRLDDADHLPLLDLVAVGDGHGQDGALHRGDDRVAAARAAAALSHSLLSPTRERAPRGLGLRDPNLEAPTVDLDRTHALDRGPTWTRLS